MTRNCKFILFILGLFVVAVVALTSSSGTDITSSYISCRLVLTGKAAHLYAYDPTSFNAVSDKVWLQIAASKGVNPRVVLSPFVQTPLWPYILQPLCAGMSFPAFNLFFEIVLASCFAALIWLTGRHWTYKFFTPLWVSSICVLWIKADPLRDALQLTNTHAIFLVLTLLAILWARSGKPMLAGASLAMAAVVKITPAVFLIYWLVTKQKKAAVSFVLWSAALFIITVAASGKVITLDYLHSMSRVSHILLLSDGNQSLAAWWMGYRYPPSWVMGFRSLPMPAALSMISSLFVVLSAIVGGYYDLRVSPLNSKVPPYGAVIAFIGATIFTPIAWGHYYILLVIPMILLLDDYLRDPSVPLIACLAAIFLLANTKVLLRQLRYLHLPASHVERGEFYAGLVAIFSMLFLFKRRLQSSALPTNSAVNL